MSAPSEHPFPTDDEDRDLLPTLQSVTAQPVFIMGLHRSGTTFIYDSIARCFPLANLDLYSLFYYPRLLKNHRDGGEERDRAALNRHFEELGIADRGLDHVEINDRTVEEYVWLLNRDRKLLHLKTNRFNHRRLDQIARKLCVTQGTQAALLKNPFDYTNGPAILRYFPQARFVYVSREPAETLQSLLDSGVEIGEEHPYFDVLKDRQPLAIRWGMSLLAARNRRSNRERIQAKSVGLGVRHLKAQLVKAQRSLSGMPDDRYVTLDYRGFTMDPVSNLRRVGEFLGLEFVTDPSEIEPRPRSKPLNPLVEQHREELARLPRIQAER